MSSPRSLLTAHSIGGEENSHLRVCDRCRDVISSLWKRKSGRGNSGLLGVFNGTDPVAGRGDVLYGGLGKALEPLEGGRTEHLQRWVSFQHEECCWEILG